MRSSDSRLRTYVVMLLVMLVGVSTAVAQEDEAGTPATVAGAPISGEVGLEVVQLGLDGRARPGDWAGIQVQVELSRTARVQNVLIRLSVPDSDGDTAEITRTIAANPGVKQTVWLYAWLPSNMLGRPLYIRAYEAEESESGEFVAGRLLGERAALMNTQIDETSGAVLLVGTREAGLGQFRSAVDPSSRPPVMPTAHEVTEIVRVSSIGALPDRWMGYMAFEAVVWTLSGLDGGPSNLKADQAFAIEEYVRRGGHLIVVLPSAGQDWFGATNNPLGSIMPAVRVTREEGVSLEPYRLLLTREPPEEAPLPTNAFLHVFEPPDGGWSTAGMSVLDGPDGRSVACRRVVGAGAVTVLGIDPSLQTLTNLRVLEADILWNRILGKRVRLLTPEALKDLRDRGVIVGVRDLNTYDSIIPALILKTGRAAGGLLLAFLVFVVYWLVAGPLGYMLLVQKGRRHHAWVAFFMAIGVFTLVAWGGAAVFKPSSVDAQHLTMLDSVYGQPASRARGWVEVYVPSYGNAVLSAGTPAQAPTDFHHAMTAWTSGEGIGQVRFPDLRGYTVDTRSPCVLNVPVRSTSKQLQVDWAGPLTGRWSMIRPLLPEGSDPTRVGDAVTLRRVPGGQQGRRTWELTGTLVHGLPAALEDVVVIVVRGQKPLSSVLAPSELLAEADAFRVNEAWEPGVAMDLSVITQGNSQRSTDAKELLRALVKRTGLGQGVQVSASSRDIPDLLLALSLYSVLEPPAMDARLASRDIVGVQRRSMHGLDVSRWFTQPCVLVIGVLKEAPTPIPLRVDGEEVETVGRTVVRWVYPLGASPPEYRSAGF